MATEQPPLTTHITVICGKETLVEAVASAHYPEEGDLLDLKGTLYHVTKRKMIWSPFEVSVLLLVCEIPADWYRPETDLNDEIY